MKRLLFAGLLMALFSGSTAFAQSNGGYMDDVYYNGTQAQQDAKTDAKKQKKQQQTQGDAEYYNSSTGNNDGYSTDGNAQVYNDSYNNGDDTYIDYDDDSYTSRIRRFQYPMYNTGYWGSVYSPSWYDPFYSNPYYGWGGWYTPGFSIGFGGGPYWNNCWGMNTWYGYGMFNSWYSPFGGYGGWGGYGGGYWNGYYAGLYDGGRYNNVGYGRGAVNYGPRGSRNGLTSVGSYGRSSGMRAANTGNNMSVPMNGRSTNSLNRNSAIRNNRGMQVEGQRNMRERNSTSRDNAIRLNNNRSVEMQQNAAGGRQSIQQQAVPERRGGFLGNMFRGNGNNVERNSIQRNNNNAERAQPSRNYNYTPSSSAPSRSFSSPAPSRSSGGGGGGGARMSSGRR